MAVNLRIETEQEDDGRWIAEVPELPGVMVYGDSRDNAVARVKALALRVLADRLENGEPVSQTADSFSMFKCISMVQSSLEKLLGLFGVDVHREYRIHS
jgi:predicted RNase H-like HicB family nuclease